MSAARTRARRWGEVVRERYLLEEKLAGALRAVVAAGTGSGGEVGNGSGS